MTDHMLYGFEGDEYLDYDPAAVYERWANDHDYDPPNMLMADWGRPEKLEIIEWSSNSGDEFMPSAARIAEWASEVYCDDAMFEDPGDQMGKAASAPDVIEAFEAARQLMLSKVAFRFADRELRKLTVTWDAEGQPLLDGEPMYRKVVASEVDRKEGTS
jgi:hypothetical protein